MGQLKDVPDIPYRCFCEGDVLITISGVLPDGDLIAYQKDERTSYANGIPVLAVAGEELVPRVLAVTALTARSTELVELGKGKKSHFPQRNGTFNVSLLKRGIKCLEDNPLQVITISEIYPQMPIKMGKSEFSFDLIRCEWSEESAKIEGDFITFKTAKIAVADVVAYFAKYSGIQIEHKNINQRNPQTPMKTNNVNSDFFISYDKIDDFQRQLINKQIDRPMVVAGSAGSGKSLIALHKAKQVATLGKSYAVIVYTKTLKKYFKDGLKELGLDHVYHYHHWNHDAHNVDCLIIDECQDFTREEIEEIIKYGKTYYMFGDTDQSIMDFPNHHPQSVETTAYKLNISLDKLYKNYRLTKQVAKLAEQVGGVNDLIDRCTRDGELPHLIKANSYDSQLDKIAEIIRNRNLTNVGILLPHNSSDKGPLSVEYVKDYLARKGVTCEYKYNANQDTEMDLDFNSRNPKIMTWWCAKGLQFKDVFIPGCEYSCEGSRKSALYVAMTRCCERLYLGYTGELSSIFPKASSEIYNTSGTIKMI